MESRRPKFNKPDFVGDQFSVDKFSHKAGQAVEIRALDELPPNVLERMPDDFDVDPDGYVIKEYMLDKASEVALFWHDFKGKVDEASLVEKYEVLQKRQKMLKEYFADILPDLVLESNFFIASGEDGDMHIYEIQRRLVDHINADPDMFTDYVASLSNEQKQQLSDEIDLFIDRFMQMVRDESHEVYKDNLPDLHENNVAFTKTGHIRLYDTNIDRDKHAVSARSSLSWMVNSLKLLKNKLV